MRLCCLKHFLLIIIKCLFHYIYYILNKDLKINHQSKQLKNKHALFNSILLFTLSEILFLNDKRFHILIPL
jgi:hypothetical protein